MPALPFFNDKSSKLVQASAWTISEGLSQKNLAQKLFLPGSIFPFKT